MKVENTSAFNNACLEFTNDNSTSYIGLGGSSVGNILTNRLFFQSPKDINFTVNGGISNAMFMNTSGNIGIGTTSPSYTLDVNGPIRVGGQINFNWGSNYQKLIDVTWTGFWDQVRFYTPGNLTGNPQMYLQPNGLGIGVEPSYKLDVQGDVCARGAFLRTTGATGWYNDTYGGGWYMNDNDTVRVYNNKNIQTTGTMTIGNLKLTDGFIYLRGGADTNNGLVYTGSPQDGPRLFGYAGGQLGTANGTNALVWKNNGYVGIGTGTPIYPLQVSGTANGDHGWAYSLYYQGTAYMGYIPDAGSVYSIKSNNRILAERVDVFSDSRIKKNIVDIDDMSALNVIRQVQPKRYQYVDEIKKGQAPVWGFIAQQIESVLDYAVSITTDFIPDIYDVATITSDMILTLTNKSTSVFNIEPGKIITIQLYSRNEKHCVTLKEIIDDHTFMINEEIELEEIDGGKIFVYGQQVDDFHNLNKEAIFTVAVAALQEVDRELQDTKAELQDTKTELDTLKAFIQSKFPGELN
jgi:hypothetical protein